MEKKSMKWGWIIFWLIIFWPVGLFFLIKKLATDKSALMSGKTGALLTVGWILIVFGVMGFSVEISSAQDPFGFIIAAIFLAGGVLLLLKAFNIKKTAIKYKKYIDIVVNQNVRNIDNIASAVGLPYDTVAKDLQDMINIGYLRDAYIHQGNHEITLKQNESVSSPQEEMFTGQTLPRTKAVRCPGCGANNVVAVGRISECEYCSTPIDA